MQFWYRFKDKKASLLIMGLLLFCLDFAQAAYNVAPEIFAEGDQVYCPLTAIPIVTNFDIIDPDDTGIDAFYIQISTGYQRGFDLLSLTNSHPTISASWNSQEGKLTLTGTGGGSMLYADLIAAVKDVIFESTSESPTEEKFFSFTIGSANYLPETGHYYEYVPQVGVNWEDARVAAQNRIYFGLQGYLVTVTSAAEAQITGEQVAGTGWIGGSDAQTEGVWKWMTGPEAGQIFWNGNYTGSTPNFAFWNTNEPNNLNDEDYAHVTAPGVGIIGSWNDLPIGGGDGDYQPKGYVVEYGGMPGDPVLNLSASTKITVPKISVISSGTRCGPGTVILEATATLGQVLWFDAEGNNLGSGDSFETPFLDSTSSFYVLASYNGCTTGQKALVQAEVKVVPEINDGITLTNCDGDGVPDGFTNFDLTQYLYLLSANYESFNFSFYLTEMDAENEVNQITANNFNNAVTNELFFRANGVGEYCHAVGSLYLEVSTTSFPEGYSYDLQACDQGENDGIAKFNLQDAEADMMAQFPLENGLTVTFYQTEDDALYKRNEIGNIGMYSNSVPYSETLFVRVDDEGSGTCFGVGEYLTLTVWPIPSFELESEYSFCTGGQVVVSPMNTAGSYSYSWRNAANDEIGTAATISISEVGSYSAVGTSEEGCISAPVYFEVTESGPPHLLPEYVVVDDDEDTGTITILNENGELGLGEYDFFLDELYGTNGRTSVFKDVEPGLHTLFAVDKNGCGMDWIQVGVVGVPKFFSPNDDGVNDILGIKGITNEFYQEGSFSVFDRYGKLLVQLDPLLHGWTGFYNGRPLPPSDYWYVLQLVDHDGALHLKKGHFTLKQ
ncbi:T9SS type B sorting domain-containing protein [Flagellimonas sediminis]|uniref:T9SS type B sorting domain-containing protein n=1 Tax=Flagellimonas sediminis TaxID=2696468 RepID=A0A6I5L3W2_9FLAO|nr:T9SS type B sorting domain-containing protein [Allomuricauda sediminis]NDV43640.1 T9SS type B sorting domain-containing protein [Allomuricauda sediminis]